MPKATKRKAPSRVRYEQGHPTISCRVPKAIYERLQAIKEAEGKSFADILKIGLGVIEVKAGNEDQVRKQGYSEGYRKGHAEAERTYKVTYPCVVCGKILTVTTRDEKETIKKYMQQHGWGHAECHGKRR